MDDLGQRLRLDAPPQRIVSLMPALTEGVCMLGACARLVGTDRFSNWPEAVRALPKLGGLDDSQIERISALRPDLVLMGRSARLAQRLRALGLPVLVLEPTRQAEVLRVLRLLGQALDSPRAEGLIGAMDAGLAAAAASVPAALRGQRVYFEVGDGPFAASEDSFIGELLARLGLRNVVPASLGRFPRLSPEWVLRADPDLILLSDGTAQTLARRPGWDRLRALQAGRLCVFTADAADVLVRPGPRLAEAASLLATCLRERGP